MSENNIESKVPGEQRLREAAAVDENDKSSVVQGDVGEITTDDDFTLSPVITVTKQESAFTKGDLKLQKVTVTEDISSEASGPVSIMEIENFDEDNSLEDTAKSIKINEITNSSETITENSYFRENSGPESIIIIQRDEEKGGIGSSDKKCKLVNDETGEECVKRISKIPKLTFKQAVNKVRSSRKLDRDSEQMVLHTHKLRSGIPRLKDHKNKQESTSMESNSTKEYKIESPATDEEFEKIYEEIIDSPLSLSESIISTQIKDSEKVESKFEEIIHAYDEDKNPPIKIEKVKSKIPMLKRKSEAEIKLPKEIALPRRSSLDKSCKIPVYNNVKPETKTHFLKTEVLETAVNLSASIQEENVQVQNQTVSSEITENMCEIANINIEKVTMSNTKDQECIKENAQTTTISKIEERTNTKISSITSNKQPMRHVSMEDKLIKEDSVHKVILKNSLSETYTHSEGKYEINVKFDSEDGKTVSQNLKEIENNDFDNANEVVQNSKCNLDKNSVEITLQLINEDTVKDLHKNINNNHILTTESEILSQEQSIDEIPITILNEEISSDQKILHTSENKIDPVRVVTLNFSNNKSAIYSNVSEVQPKRIPLQAEKGNDENAEDLNINTSGTEEIMAIVMDNTLSSTYNKESQETISHNENVAEDNLTNKDFIIEKYEDDVFENNNKNTLQNIKLKNIDTPISNNTRVDRETLNNNINQIRPPFNKQLSSKLNDINDIEEEDIIILKGKVRRVISRLDSREPKTNKIDLDDLPQNVSVLSKIAIFERTELQKEPEFIKTPPLKSPIDVPKKPRIIDQILKEKNHENQSEKTRPEILKDVMNDNINSNINEVLNIRTPPELLNTERITDTTNLNHEYVLKTHENSRREKYLTSKYKKSNNDSDEDIKNNIYMKKTDEIYNMYKAKQFDKYHDTDMKRAKSMAELDLGNAVTGKVKEMVIRMKSVDRLDVARKEVIDAREKPRRGSVSERIALFEKKLTPVQMEELSPSQPKRVHTTEVIDTAINEKIAQLSNAKFKYGKFENMTYITLPVGVKMPVLVVGTSLVDRKLIYHTISTAIDLGYRAIDCAYIYGNEREVGEAINAKIQDGTVRREDLFIISKLWSTFHRRDLVVHSCKASLATMGLDYFDLYLIHNPMSFKEGKDPVPKIANVLQYSEHDYLDAWFGIENVIKLGLAKYGGLSNFNSTQIDRVVEKGKIKPIANQVESHPYLNQLRLDEFCQARNVSLISFGCLGSKGTPKEHKSDLQPVIDDPLVKVMAAGLGVTPAQLLISYQLHLGRSVVVKGSSSAHLWDNLQAINVSLNAEHVTALNALNKNKRTFTFEGFGDTHKNYPFKIPF